MAAFEPAVRVVLAHEGGYTVDTGGPTNYGITLATLRTMGPEFADLDGDGDIDALDVRNLNRGQAEQVYKDKWWNPYGYAHIACQDAATKIFDLAVNMGPAQGHKIAQRALIPCHEAVIIDGVIGPITTAAINRVPPGELLVAMRCLAAEFYCGLVRRNPDKYGKYLEGWLNRAYY